MTYLPPKLDIRAGQKWLTALGHTVRITVGPTDASSEYPIYALHVGGAKDDTYLYFNRYGCEAHGDKLVELLPDPAAAARAAYMADLLADELALADLLGWKNFGKPEEFEYAHKMYGSHDKARGHNARDCLVPMPQWRRSWSGAGELIARCKLSISPTDGGAAVHAETGPVFRAPYHEHPTEDDAIRFAICKAAIAYLRAPP